MRLPRMMMNEAKKQQCGSKGARDSPTTRWTWPASIVACVSAVVMASSCVVHLPFNHRVSYGTLTKADLVPLSAPPVSIRWQPEDFAERVDSVSPSGFVAAATLARIPTGAALSGRITEVLDHSVGVSSDQRTLTIVVIDVETEYEYSMNLLNTGLAIDRAKCTLELELRYGDERWTQVFRAEEIDEHIGGGSITGALERAWDRIALDVGRSVTERLTRAGGHKVKARDPSSS